MSELGAQVRAHSPCKIAPYSGHAPFWARRGARQNLGVRFRLLRTVSTRRVFRCGILGRTVMAPPGWPRALDRERCSGQIGASLSRRGPRRPRCPVVLSQSYRGHPAATTDQCVDDYASFTTTQRELLAEGRRKTELFQRILGGSVLEVSCVCEAEGEGGDGEGGWGKVGGPAIQPRRAPPRSLRRLY